MTAIQLKWFGDVAVTIYLINTKPTSYMVSAIYENDYRLIARTEREYKSMADAQDAMKSVVTEHLAGWSRPSEFGAY